MSTVPTMGNDKANRRILIVDDNEDIHDDFRKILAGTDGSGGAFQNARSAFLGQAGSAATGAPVFELTTAVQGQEGLQRLEAGLEEGEPFALAFVDVRMPPGWDGIETIRRFWERDSDLQVVICTAYADYSFEEIVEVLGSSDRLLILKKPFDPVEVRQLAVALTEKWNLIQRDRERMEELQRTASELEEANKALEEANVRAEAANRAKSEFLANMSHEIRTPMTGILGYGDLICDGSIPLEDRLKYGEIIRKSGDHLLTILNDILDISKIESGRMELSVRRFSPVELVTEVVQLMRTQADQKQLALGVEWRTAVPAELESDPMRVRQVLLNLIGNAIKFTEQGSVTLSVGVEDGEDGSSKLLCFDVVDTGVGVEPENLPTLFDAFSQADTSMTREAGGTGLGLAISRRLALMLGGSIHVESEIGKGSTFGLHMDVGDLAGLEMVRPSEGNDEVRSTPREDEQPGRLCARILLVEDGAVNQLLISTVLKKAGAEVCVADDGRAGCRAVEQAQEEGEPFDLVLMDMQMPVMDGYAATRALREKGFTLPIVALTAHAMTGDREACLDAGCTDYANKPIDRVGLIDLCKRLVELEGAAAPIPSDPADRPAPLPDEAA